VNIRGVADLDLARVCAGPKTPSSSAWEDGSAVQDPEDARRWRDAGLSRVGGTLAGIRSKLDYLTGLGVTALWISPS